MCDLFFVKQKTAYEMRSSDWRSDVCSSDLIAGAWRYRIFTQPRQRRSAWAPSRDQQLCEIVFLFSRKVPRYSGIGRFSHTGTSDQCNALDRKSVVEGTSVSVRVVHRGRLIIKKKLK